METFRAVVSGIVQGVGYRWFAVARAGELNIAGHAKNLPTGQVEVLAAADDRAALETFLEALREGPGLSNVTLIEVEWNIAGEVPPGEFIIKY